jgi:hypothetical protein
MDKYNYRIGDWAAYDGDVSKVEWILENVDEYYLFSSDAVDMAVFMGHFNVAILLHKKGGIIGTPQAINWAIMRKCMFMLKYLIEEMKLTLSPLTALYIIRDVGWIKGVDYLLKKGLISHKHAEEDIIRNGNNKMILHYLNNHCSKDDIKNIGVISWKSNIEHDIKQNLESNGFPTSDKLCHRVGRCHFSIKFDEYDKYKKLETNDFVMALMYGDLPRAMELYESGKDYNVEFLLKSHIPALNYMIVKKIKITNLLVNYLKDHHAFAVTWLEERLSHHA